MLVQGTALPAAPEDITAEWLTHALGHDVAAVEFSEVAWGTATQDLNREPTRVQAVSLNQHDSIRVRRSV